MVKAKPKKRRQPVRRKTQSSPRKPLPKIFGKAGAFVAFLSMFVITFVAGMQWINNPENLTIKSVEVKGSLSVLDKTVLQSVIDPYTKTNLYLLDTEALEKSIENNSWVRSASMTKVWPETLVIKIQEQKPIAFWGEEAMLATNGDIIKAVQDDVGINLPLLYSPNDEGLNMAKRFIQVREWLKGLPFKMVEFTEDTRGSWQIKLENGMTLKIGRNQQKKRLRRFMVGYEESLVNIIDKISVVDLRYTNGFSVKWKKGLSANKIFKEI